MGHVERLVADVKQAMRSLAHSPTFTIVAVVTLALGIGANTAMFSLLDATLLKPLPYPEPDRLVKLWGRFTGIGIPGDRNWISVPEFRDIQSGQRSFSAVAAIDTTSFNLVAGPRPERISGASVSPELFAILQVPPAVGRVFTGEEAQLGRDNVAILSYTLWQRSFGADPRVVGRVVRIDGATTEIVGVMPQGFAYPDDAEIWTPRAFKPEELGPDYRGSHSLQVLARLKPGVSMEQSRADLASLSESIIQANPEYHYRQANFTLLMVPLVEETVGDVRSALYLLMGAVAFVLLIACVNVANLQLVRSSSRAHELAVRAALGAGRGRLVMLLLVESALLAVAGAVVGVLAARWTLAGLVPLAARAFPRVAETAINGSVLAFTGSIAVATVLLFGMVPALAGTRADVTATLKSASRLSAHPTSRRLRRLLVTTEIALALVLLAGAGLLGRSLLNVLDVDSGFNAADVLTFRVSLPTSKYAGDDRRRAFFRDLLDRVRRIPGVSSAGAITLLPLTGSSSGTTTVDSPVVSGEQAMIEADYRAVLPGYFETMRIRLISGRFFTAADNETSAPVAIVDETMARTYWPGQNAVGQRLRIGGDKSPNPWLTIVGVVSHVHYRTLEAASRVEVYWPEFQDPWPFETFTVRAAVDPASLRPAIEREVLSIDPDQPVSAVRTMSEIVAESIARRRLATMLLAIFAGLALVLAAVGVYGLTAYAVTERAPELGIRMALGAEPARIVRSIVGQSLVLAGAGIVVGLAGAAALARVVAAQLFAVPPADPLTFVSVAALLALVGLVASYGPARRAARIDPAVTLRAE